MRKRPGLHTALLLSRDVTFGTFMDSCCCFNFCLAVIPEKWLSPEIWLFTEASGTRSLVVVLGRTSCKATITPRGGVHDSIIVRSNLIPRPLAHSGVLGVLDFGL